ncbi:MAG: hypothetical protein KGR26_13140 [Cyanobacteria bacterium REEB65]|nr:hypothetical protein [Cyanobacteria bacterium REEB65]
MATIAEIQAKNQAFWSGNQQQRTSDAGSFTESDHPRDSDGKFGSGGGKSPSPSSPASVPAKWQVKKKTPEQMKSLSDRALQTEMDKIAAKETEIYHERRTHPDYKPDLRLSDLRHSEHPLDKAYVAAVDARMDLADHAHMRKRLGSDWVRKHT